MDKSRLLSQLDLLEKYVAGKSSFKSKEEEIASFRNLTTKILGLIEGPEKTYRDVIVKHSGQIDSLINVIQTVNDSQTSYNVVKIINEVVGRTNSGKRAQLLVHHGVSKALLQCIYVESKEPSPCEEFLFLLHQVLYRVAVKDKRIGIRARISQCLPVVVNLLRTQINLVPHNRGATGNIPISNSLAKIILNLLYVLRLYSQNLINTSRLGRMGIVTLLLKIISYSGKNNTTILKVSVETLNLCVRTKSNSSRAVNQGGMAMLLELFLEWHRMDTKDKQLTLRKCILSVIKNMINLRSGKKAFLEADGLHLLYGFCETNKFQQNLEALVTIASLILRKCFPKNRLPLSHYGSVMRCPLPTTVVHHKTRLLLDYCKTESSPSAPRSTSPIDVNPEMPILNCQGDNQMENFGSEDFFHDVITDDHLQMPVKGISIEKLNNRIRAGNLFRSLDEKLSISRKESLIRKRHQTYLNKYCNYSNENDSESSNLAKSPTIEPYEPSTSPFQEYNDEKKDKNDQTFVEEMLVNSVSYQPPDDRPFDKLKQCYEKFFLEKDLLKKKNSDLKKKIPSGDSDKSDKSDNSNEDGLTNIENKNIKATDTLSPSVVSLQIKNTVFDRKLTRNSVPRNEISSPKPCPLTDEKIQNFKCSSISFQKRESISGNNSGLYARSKLGFNQTKNEGINITTMINDLVEIENKKNGNLSKIDAEFGARLDSVENDSNQKAKFSEPEEDFTDTYIKISSLITRSLGRFSMISYPDLMENSVKINQSEPLSDSFLKNISLIHNDEANVKLNNNNNNAKKGVKNSFNQQKKSFVKSNKNTNKANNGPRPSSASSNADALAQNKILDDLRRIIDGEDILEKVVYDLEAIIQNSMNTYNLENSCHSNADELEIDKLTPTQPPSLQFDSQFECGNLRKVIQIRQYEYDLILNPDVNNNHQIQWFYFRVSAMESNVPYRFNIINCEKPNSQFNFGMQPLFYSVKENMQGKGFWKRFGSEIFYYKNHFARSAATCGGNTGKSYYTFTFVIEFPYSSDVCYIAYHYPYTYTRLLTDIDRWTKKVKISKPNILGSGVDAEGDSKEKLLNHKIEYYSVPEDNILFYVQELCTTILGNPVPVLTISNWSKEDSDQSGRKSYIFLTSRVHPGESNSSWVMKGCIDYLLSNNPIADQLRNLYIFKIIPMLNPDGVINGCHRCSMAGHDLNRRWLDPCEFLNPTIYHTKGLLMLLTKFGQSPMVYCDFHGHSRRKNVFMFGCSPFSSWISEDTNNPTFIDSKTEDKSFLVLPNVLNNISQAFSLDCCSFVVDKSKESTARVVVWRQFGVKRSYTMESTYCGFDQGNYKNVHINVPMLEEMGHQFAESLLHIDESASNFESKSIFLPKLNSEYYINKENINDKREYSPTNSDRNCESPIDKNNLKKESYRSVSMKNRKTDYDEEDQISSNEEYDEDELESDKEIEFNEEDVEDSD